MVKFKILPTNTTNWANFYIFRHKCKCNNCQKYQLNKVMLFLLWNYWIIYVFVLYYCIIYNKYCKLLYNLCFCLFNLCNYRLEHWSYLPYQQWTLNTLTINGFEIKFIQRFTIDGYQKTLHMWQNLLKDKTCIWKRW